VARLSEDCLFCKIVNKEIPSTVVYEDEDILAFKDINPVAPVHILIIPKKHIPTITDITDDDFELIGRIHAAAGKIARDAGIFEDGFRLVNNCRSHGGQVIYHLHFHLLGGKNLGGI
jgi:histidine triad (HIT) family protein